jgi:ABC-type polysaccharide/polyol phosphate transport system ATPase subunit
MTGSAQFSRAVHVEKLRKCYPLRPKPFEVLREAFGREPRGGETIALDDVSFDVPVGECVGVVGANGAGKSTLLQILSGVLSPSGGQYEIAGRLRAVLALGAGFEMERTGRDNIMLGGLCQGFARDELEGRMSWIIDFAELEAAIDRPFRTYSSGMQARLMYSVAFCMPTDMMMIDEVLSTGDGAFIQKCIRHIQSLCSGGTTALIVSHNLFLLESLCQRVLYLKDGRLVADGDPHFVCNLYEEEQARHAIEDLEAVSLEGAALAVPGRSRKNLRARDPSGLPEIDQSPQGVPARALEGEHRAEPGGGESASLRLEESALLDASGNAVSRIQTGSPVCFRFVLHASQPLRDLQMLIKVLDEGGRCAAAASSSDSMDPFGRSSRPQLDLHSGPAELEVRVPALELGGGRYRVSLQILSGPPRMHPSWSRLEAMEH